MSILTGLLILTHYGAYFIFRRLFAPFFRSRDEG